MWRGVVGLGIEHRLCLPIQGRRAPRLGWVSGHVLVRPPAHAWALLLLQLVVLDCLCLSLVWKLLAMVVAILIAVWHMFGCWHDSRCPIGEWSVGPSACGTHGCCRLGTTPGRLVALVTVLLLLVKGGVLLMVVGGRGWLYMDVMVLWL